jgi:hypothetical protein
VGLSERAVGKARNFLGFQANSKPKKGILIQPTSVDISAANEREAWQVVSVLGPQRSGPPALACPVVVPFTSFQGIAKDRA